MGFRYYPKNPRTYSDFDRYLASPNSPFNPDTSYVSLNFMTVIKKRAIWCCNRTSDKINSLCLRERIYAVGGLYENDIMLRFPYVIICTLWSNKDPFLIIKCFFYSCRIINLDLKSQSTSSSAAPAADPSLVLAKPNNEKSDDDNDKKFGKR